METRKQPPPLRTIILALSRLADVNVDLFLPGKTQVFNLHVVCVFLMTLGPDALTVYCAKYAFHFVLSLIEV